MLSLEAAPLSGSYRVDPKSSHASDSLSSLEMISHLVSNHWRYREGIQLT